MALKILPYKAVSESAKALADALGIRRIKLEGSVWKPKARDTVINWGSSDAGHSAFQGGHRILNHPSAVKKASNKLSAFQVFKEAGVSIPEFTTQLDEATRLCAAGAMIVCRTKLTGHSGEGIVLVEGKDTDNLVRAPLYTEYIKKVSEFRLHVFGDEVFIVQRKARKHDVPDAEVNWQIRNHANGFIFARGGVDVPQEHKDLAVKAVKALGLDFGAVDLIVTKKGEAFVLEVNTACGMEGQTLDDYVQKFIQFK